ncbi:hypothetical protein J8N05_19000 [Streptomyces sp. BH-SS-21]|uniref:Integrase n=1 Tax=Streptomyces liliiviolaceus TaxID=2823109 RepID=A0A940XQQ6_9ACTN|nr:hypothetical protein [Streptomyces liliiviolaceus]MBQ0850279.1 hypothetical protein [Streptomyces liliiviolaceus]
MSSTMLLTERWPVLDRHEQAAAWLTIWTDVGRAPRTIDGLQPGPGRVLADVRAREHRSGRRDRSHIALYLSELSSLPHRWGANVISIDSGVGLANSTIQQRLVPVRLFLDFLMEEGLWDSDPVGRGRYTPGRRNGGRQRGLVPRLTKLPWIPGEQHWLSVLEVAKTRVRPGSSGSASRRTHMPD